MGIYRVVGDAIVKENDYFEALDSGALRKLEPRAKDDRSVTIALSGRAVSVKEALEPRDQKGLNYTPNNLSQVK